MNFNKIIEELRTEAISKDKNSGLIIKYFTLPSKVKIKIVAKPNAKFNKKDIKVKPYVFIPIKNKNIKIDNDDNIFWHYPAWVKLDKKDIKNSSLDYLSRRQEYYDEILDLIWKIEKMNKNKQKW